MSNDLTNRYIYIYVCMYVYSILFSLFLTLVYHCLEHYRRDKKIVYFSLLNVNFS